MKNILAIGLTAGLTALLLAPAVALAAEEGYRLDRAPNDPRDIVSLQAGARTYMNYCLGCHGMQFMRYEGLEALDLSESEIKDNLMFTAEKVGEPIRIAFNPKDAKAWFGVAPPDLSVIARSRGADWLYTYLRTFYRDPKTVTGWNNAVFPNVGMPHALWTLQGQRALDIESPKEGSHGAVEYKWTQITPGTQSAAEYDATVRDLVNFLVYVSEPHGNSRRPIGIVVLFVLGIVFVFAYLLKKEYWKDVK
ncbi:MAG TPA: cytochrome c1 [Burkholderiales bacterium]|nr:cytochrome c1 [Burkholderiales bacterium]